MERGRTHARVIGQGAGRRFRPGILLVGASLVLVAGILWIAGRGSEDTSGEDGMPPAATRAQIERRPSAPQIELLPPRTRRGRPAPDRIGAAALENPTSEPTSPAGMQRALHSSSELVLLNDLARANVAVPPAVNELFERRREGASVQELRRFVRTRFPRQIKLRMVTVRWLNRLDPDGAEPAPTRNAGRAAGPPFRR